MGTMAPLSAVCSFDENRNIITDSTLLQSQIDLLDFRPQDYWIAPGVTSDVKIIKIGDEDNGDYVNNMSFIPQAKYVGIIQRLYENSRLKVMINRADRGNIEKVKFLEIPEETYSTVNDPSDSNMVDSISIRVKSFIILIPIKLQ
jgi:hypothetical protein